MAARIPPFHSAGAEKRSRSRDVVCVRALPTKRTTKPTFRFAPAIKGGEAPKGAPSVGRARANKCAQFAPLICLRSSGRYGARSPSGASRRRLSQRANAATQPRPCFARPRGCGRYPRRQSRLSQAPGAPVVLPAGTIPEPPGSGVTSPARRNRTRSIQRLSPVDVPEVSELFVGNITGDYCQ